MLSRDGKTNLTETVHAMIYPQNEGDITKTQAFISLKSSATKEDEILLSEGLLQQTAGGKSSVRVFESIQKHYERQ